jgi:hypothetical protein
MQIFDEDNYFKGRGVFICRVAPWIIFFYFYDIYKIYELPVY